MKKLNEEFSLKNQQNIESLSYYLNDLKKLAIVDFEMNKTRFQDFLEQCLRYDVDFEKFHTTYDTSSDLIIKKLEKTNMIVDDDWWWIRFKNNLETNNYIKLYLSLHPDYLVEGMNDLIDFFEKEDIKHSSKIATEARRDAIIIRLDGKDINTVRRVINFLSNNKNIQQGRQSIPYFIPVTENGIGIMRETNISYVNEISKYITEFIFDHIDDDYLDVDDFIEEIELYTTDYNILETFYMSLDKIDKVEEIYRLKLVERMIFLEDFLSKPGEVMRDNIKYMYEVYFSRSIDGFLSQVKDKQLKEELIENDINAFDVHNALTSVTDNAWDVPEILDPTSPSFELKESDYLDKNGDFRISYRYREFINHLIMSYFIGIYNGKISVAKQNVITKKLKKINLGSGYRGFDYNSFKKK